MKANKALGSKFVYPDKLYARCKDNKTLDMSYAPQNMEAIEYTRTNAFIEKACDWLKNSSYGYLTENWGGIELDRETMAEDFRKYMKGD